MKDTPFSHMPRLQLCASFLPRGIRLCDVGTDHAYLPVALALQGAVVSALACDIRKGLCVRHRRTLPHMRLRTASRRGCRTGCALLMQKKWTPWSLPAWGEN